MNNKRFRLLVFFFPTDPTFFVNLWNKHDVLFPAKLPFPFEIWRV